MRRSVGWLFVCACVGSEGGGGGAEAPPGDAVERLGGPGEVGSGDGEEPDYAAVFDLTQVRTMDLRMDPSDHAAMLAEMEAQCGAPFGARCPHGAEFEPSWVPVGLTVDERTWTGAGLRLKGNSSLKAAWEAGIAKLPYRLDVDRFAVDGSTFYGFEELGLGNGFADPTLLREVLAAEVLEAAGVPAPRAAWWWVTLDVGDGPVVQGVYTVVESVDDTVPARAWGDAEDGPLYEADGPCATLTCIDDRSFEPKGEGTGEEIEGLVAALQVARGDPAWRQGVDGAIDTDAFLRWLAVNTALRNGDTYGGSPHNFYLYAVPGDAGRLAFIPKDHNESWTNLPMGSLDPLLADVGPGWPLVRHLLDDPDGGAAYRAALADVLTGPFARDEFEARLAERAAMLRAELYVDGPGERPGETFAAPDAAVYDQVKADLRGFTVAWRTQLEAALAAP